MNLIFKTSIVGRTVYAIIEIKVGIKKRQMRIIVYSICYLEVRYHQSTDTGAISLPLLDIKNIFKKIENDTGP